MTIELRTSDDGGLECNEGWAVRFVNPEVLEYSHGRAACLVNVGYSPAQRARAIFASESTSELFPHLREHLRTAVRHLKGHYVVV